MCHLSKHLIKYFEFLNGSRIICLLLNFSEKLHSKSWKGRDSSPLSLLIRYNTHAPWKTTSTIQTNGNHHHFFIRISILGHVLVYSVDKTHDLVVTVELIGLLFFNIFSFNFAPTPNKSLKFTRFRRSYINHSAFVLNNHCQSYTAFCLICTV